MRGYVMTTGAVFALIVLAHLWRVTLEPSLLHAPFFWIITLLLGADTAARTIAAPAEVPIGVLTALVGAPFFLALLLRQRGLAGL